jgi:hypothetical protein
MIAACGPFARCPALLHHVPSRGAVSQWLRTYGGRIGGRRSGARHRRFRAPAGQSILNEREAARAGRQRADGAASGSRRPSTTTPAATAPAPKRPGSRRGRSASSPQAEDHPTSGRTRTCPPDARTRAAPTAISRASAQVTQVFGTRRLRRHPHALTQRRAWSPAMSSATFMCCISGARGLSYGAGSINWRPFRRSVPRALPRSACSVATGPRPLGWGYQLQLDIWCPVAGQSAASEQRRHSSRPSGSWIQPMPLSPST